MKPDDCEIGDLVRDTLSGRIWRVTEKRTLAADAGAYVFCLDGTEDYGLIHWSDLEPLEPMTTAESAPSAPDAVRVTSETGASKDSRLARFDMIPTYPLRLLAERYGKGAEKYPAVNGLDNYRNGYAWSLSYAALQRHANAFWSGEDIDPDSGQPHLAAVAWHAFTLLEWGRHPDLVEKFDDRQDPRKDSQ